MDNNHPVILSALKSSAPNSRSIELNSAAIVFPGAGLSPRKLQRAGNGCEQEWLSPRDNPQETQLVEGTRGNRTLEFAPRAQWYRGTPLRWGQ